IDFLSAKQDRSKKTLDELIEAAYAIVEQEDPQAFTSRVLAKKSGYALGTLNKRLGPIENVFLWVIQKGRDKKFHEVVSFISNHSPKLNVQNFVEGLVDLCFSLVKIVNPKVMQFYDQRFTLKYGLTANYFEYVDVLVEPYIEMSSKNETGTFKKMSYNEAKLIFRAMLILAERPFAECNPIAGTAEHRKIAVEACTRLLQK
ncbi:MAG: hypothetical protein WCP66_10400, partial [Methylococcales bacterium]